MRSTELERLDRRRAAEVAELGALEPAATTHDLVALLELARRVCDVQGAAVNVIVDDAQHQIAAVGVEPSVCTRADSMCAVVLDQPMTVVGDARLDGDFAHNPFVDGRLDDIRFYASTPLVSARGVVIGRLCVFDRRPGDVAGADRDALEVIAERVMDVLQLRNRTRQLERSNQRLADFATQVGHDLASPLAAIRLHLELATADLREGDPDSAPQLLDEAASVTRRMTQQIDGILRAARQEVAPQRDRVDLAATVEAVRRDLAAAIVTSRATVTTGLLPIVPGDPALLHALLLNLVSNALKFSRQDHPPRVHVACRREGSAWALEVVDQGLGIRPEDRERVFERYARGTAAEVPGHGIGLASARQIADAHGGSISVESHEGPGVTMQVRLPG